VVAALLKVMQEQIKPSLKGLAHRLVTDGILSEDKMRQIVEQATANQISVVKYLANNSILKSSVLAQSVAVTFGMPLLDLNAFDIEQLPEKQISEKLIRQYNVLPLYKRNHCLYLAMVDPGNQSVLDEIKFHTGLTICSIVVEEEKLIKLIQNIWDNQENPTFRT
jgi:type IV pilus assembly protein PilB